MKQVLYITVNLNNRFISMFKKVLIGILQGATFTQKNATKMKKLIKLSAFNLNLIIVRK